MALFDYVIPRDTFKVNCPTQLLSPLIVNYRLRIQMDNEKKSDILAVLYFMQINKQARVESVEVLSSSWSDSLRRLFEIGPSVDIPADRFKQTMKELAPYLIDFTLLEVRKPKHLKLIPPSVLNLTLKEDSDFQDYQGIWKREIAIEQQ